jgi:hypothetical protein
MYRKSSKKVTKPSFEQNLKSNDNKNKPLPRRKLKNDHLNLMLQSSEYLLEDFVELEAQVILN